AFQERLDIAGEGNQRVEYRPLWRGAEQFQNPRSAKLIVCRILDRVGVAEIDRDLGFLPYFLFRSHVRKSAAISTSGITVISRVSSSAYCGSMIVTAVLKAFWSGSPRSSA